MRLDPCVSPLSSHTAVVAVVVLSRNPLESSPNELIHWGWLPQMIKGMPRRCSTRATTPRRDNVHTGIDQLHQRVPSLLNFMQADTARQLWWLCFALDTTQVIPTYMFHRYLECAQVELTSDEKCVLTCITPWIFPHFSSTLN